MTEHYEVFHQVHNGSTPQSCLYRIVASDSPPIHSVETHFRS